MLGYVVFMYVHVGVCNRGGGVLCVQAVGRPGRQMRCTRPAHYGRRASRGALGWCITAAAAVGLVSD